MNKKLSAALLSWAIVSASVAPAAPAFAAGQFRAETRAMPAVIAAPAALNPSLRQALTLPNGSLTPTGTLLPTSLLPAGVAAAAAESGLRQAPAASATALPVFAAASAGAAPQARAAAAASVAASPAFAGAPSEPHTSASSLSPTAKAPGAVRAMLGHLTSAIAGRLSWARVFDVSSARGSSPVAAMGLQPMSAPVLPQDMGIDLSPAPATPRPGSVGGVELNAFDVPGARTAGGIFDSSSRVLQADANSEADVERALREMIDADAARYGVVSSELQTVHVKRVEGHGNQADSIFAYFRQQRKSTNPDGSVQAVDIQGSYLSFTIKVVKNKPTVMAAMARLYPNIAVRTGAAFSDAELKSRAEQKLPQGQGVELAFFERKIIFHQGAWKTVNLYHLDGLPQAVGVMVAVDVASGDVFAWDARMGITGTDAGVDAAPEAAVSGTAAARGEKDDQRPNGKAVLSEQVLPWLNVSISGKAGQTDAKGKFSGSASGAAADFTATLAGKWVQVNDQARKPVKVSASLTPGQDATVVFNPTQSDEGTVSQVNTYLAVTHIHDWWSQRLKNDKRIDRAIPANVNIDDECNAYYTPGRPSLNFFKSSRNCSDTARPGVVAHEYGHFVVDMIVPATTGGLHEGWGDIGSMFLLGTPVIGDGFLKNRTPSYIRHGDNKYQFSDNDEVHDQGQAWMGFAWKLRKALIAALGEAAGAAEAEALIIPTLFAGSTEIPAAMAQVLANAIDKNGNVRYEKEIRAAAKAHGIDLPKNPGLMATLWNNTFGMIFGAVGQPS